MTRRPFAYWLFVAVMATLLLAGGSLAASGALRPPRGQLVITEDGVGIVNGKIQHKVSNTNDGRAIFAVDGLLPGWAGRRRLVLSNTGPRPFTRVTLTQDHVVMGGFSAALQLQIYDVSARRCLYPRPPAGERVPNVKVEDHRCAGWMPFDGRRDMHFLVVPGKDGTTTWKRAEQHLIFVRWRLAPSSPNSDQGKRASFRLRWNTHG